MPSNISFLDTNFPTFTDEDSTEKKINTIQDYLYMTVESLRYALSHLNEGNMEQSFVDSIIRGDGSIAEIIQKVGEHEASITALVEVTGELGENMAEISETVDEQGGSISLIVQNVGSNGTVTAASIVAAVNATTGQSKVSIDADHIVMTGQTTFLSNNNYTTYCDAAGTAAGAISVLESSMASGTTTINGGCITTKTIALNNIACNEDSLTIYNSTGQTVIGNIGYETGLAGGTETNGMAMKYDSTHYVICTSAGVRLQSGSNSIWVTDSGTSIGQAVFG